MIKEEVLGRVANAAFTMHRNQIPEIENFIESFRPNQIKCKKWLVEELLNFQMSFDKVLIVGSWNGVLLGELLAEHGDITWIDFLDIDPITHVHRDAYFDCNGLKKNYGSIIMDAKDFSDYQSYDLVINTSCEHMPDIPAVYGPLYAIQSNNYNAVKDHINCCDNETHLAMRNGITRVMYKGSKKMPNYDRFMVIGYYH